MKLPSVLLQLSSEKSKRVGKTGQWAEIKPPTMNSIIDIILRNHCHKANIVKDHGSNEPVFYAHFINELQAPKRELLLVS